MNWLQSILYGFIVSFCEFIPISTLAQEQLLQSLFGLHGNDYIRSLIIHLFTLAAFLTAWRAPLEMFNHNIQLSRRRRGNYGRATKELADAKFIRGAAIPMLLTMILVFYFTKRSDTLPTILLLLLGGIILYLPQRMLQGNKSARAMSVMDAWVIGIVSAFGVIPGFSRIGMTISVAQMRGADRRHALNWGYMLSIPALLLLIGGDLVNLIFNSQFLAVSSGFGGYLLICISSFAGAYTSVYFMRNIILNHGLNGFAYYSWGAALFAFILYLL